MMSTVSPAPPPTIRFALALSWAFRTVLDRVLPASLFGFVAASRLHLLIQRLHQTAPLDDAEALLIYRLDLIHQAVAGAFLALVAVLCLTRKAPRTQRAGLLPITVALAGTLMMVYPAMQPRTLDDRWILVAASLLVIVGLAYTLYAVGNLGSCFGIAPEARGLVMSGAYRHVRHPVYLGEFIAALGVLLPVLSPLTAAAFLLFIAFQRSRVHLEERVLESAFPAYAEYRQTVPMLFPWPRPAR
ncbi:MAG: methyltransferase family protein [Chloroflexota bacterium]